MAFVTGLTALFGLSNIFLFSQAIDYFGQSAKFNMYSHTWSLGVEEQFYLLFPWLLFWRLKSTELNNRFIALSILTISSLLGYIIFYPANQPAAYFLMPFRFWELGVGCITAICLQRFSLNNTKFCQKLNPAVPFVLIIIGLCISEQHTVPVTVLVVFSTAVLIISIKSNSIVYQILTLPAVVYVGMISYSLYLWHWYVISLSRWTLGIHSWTLPFQLLLIVLLSMLSYHLIEIPCRRGTWFKQKWSIVFAGFSALVSAATLMLLSHQFDFPSFSGNFHDTEKAVASPVPGYKGRYSGRTVDICNSQNIFSGNKDNYTDNIKRCLAENESPALLTFVGDSHALDLFPMSEKIFISGVASVLNIYQPGCRVPPLKTEGIFCGYVTNVLNYLSTHNKAGKSVLVIRTNYSPKIADGSLASFASNLEQFLDETNEKNLTVVYFAPSPKYAGVGPGSFCSVQWFRPDWSISGVCKGGGEVSRNEQLARRQDFMNYLKQLEKSRSNFVVFDPFNILCGPKDDVCSPLRSGNLIYRDSSHLTEGGSELISTSLIDFLAQQKLLDTN